MKDKGFRSLDKLSNSIGFIQTALARISGLLLMAGIIVATANLLNDDTVFRGLPWLQGAWGWSQALAVDAGLAVIFARLYESIRDKNYPAIWAYTAIGTLLFLVAGSITAIESVRQAFNTSLVTAAGLMHIPLLILTPVRAIVAVALVAVSNIDIMTTQSPDPTPTPIKEESLPAPLLNQPTSKKAVAQDSRLKGASNGNGRGEKGVRVLEYLTINPQAATKDVMAATGASRSTVVLAQKRLAGASPWKGLAGKEEEVVQL